MTETKEAPKKEKEKSHGVVSKVDKAIEHVVEAMRSINQRIVHLSETESLLVRTHLDAAVNHAQGNTKEAKQAEERISELKPEEPTT